MLTLVLSISIGNQGEIVEGKKPEMAFRVFLFLFSCLKIRENEGSDQQTMMAASLLGFQMGLNLETPVTSKPAVFNPCQFLFDAV